MSIRVQNFWLTLRGKRLSPEEVTSATQLVADAVTHAGDAPPGMPPPGYKTRLYPASTWSLEVEKHVTAHEPERFMQWLCERVCPARLRSIEGLEEVWLTIIANCSSDYEGFMLSPHALRFVSALNAELHVYVQFVEAGEMNTE